MRHLIKAINPDSIWFESSSSLVGEEFFATEIHQAPGYDPGWSRARGRVITGKYRGQTFYFSLVKLQKLPNYKELKSEPESKP